MSPRKRGSIDDEVIFRKDQDALAGNDHFSNDGGKSEKVEEKETVTF